MTDRDRAHKFLLDELQYHDWEPRIALLAAEFAAIREESIKKVEEWAKHARLDGKKTVTAEQMGDHLEALASVFRGMGNEGHTVNPKLTAREERTRTDQAIIAEAKALLQEYRDQHDICGGDSEEDGEGALCPCNTCEKTRALLVKKP